MQSAQAHPQQPQVAGPQPPRPTNVSREAVRQFQTIFPQYLDAELTPAEGRRLTKAQAVSTPTLDEMVLALRQLGYKGIAVDPRKSLPRVQGSEKFPFVPRGCVKVQIKEPASEHYVKKSEFDTQTRNAVVPGLESKHQVLVRMAAIIKEHGGERPKLPTVTEVIDAAARNQPKIKK